jgi:hypothetical protein
MTLRISAELKTPILAFEFGDLKGRHNPKIEILIAAVYDLSPGECFGKHQSPACRF